MIIENWRREYNQLRPHSSLGYRPPAPEAFKPMILTLGVALDWGQVRKPKTLKPWLPVWINDVILVGRIVKKIERGGRGFLNIGKGK